MIRIVEVGQVYKLVDANPPAFGKVKKSLEANYEINLCFIWKRRK